MVCGKRVICSILWLWMVLGWVKITLSGETHITPSLTVRGEYNDNLVMSLRDPQDDYITLISPTIEHDYKTERFNSSANLGVTQWFYATETDLNTLDQRYDVKAAYDLTPMVAFNVSGSYLRDTTLEEQLLETGYVAIRTDRELATGSSGLSFQLAERTTLDANYSNTHAWYESRYYPDTTIHRGLININHQFKNVVTSGLLQAAYTHYGYQTAETDNWQLLVGLRHLFSETFDITALGGMHYTQSQYGYYGYEWRFEPPYVGLVVIEREERESHVGWVANVELNKRFERSTIKLGFTRDVMNAAYGDTIENTRTSFSLSHSLSERLQGVLSGGYYRIRSLMEEGVGIDWDTYSISPALRYELTEYLSSELRYQYISARYQAADISVGRNMIALLLNFTWPK